MAKLKNEQEVWKKQRKAQGKGALEHSYLEAKKKDKNNI